MISTYLREHYINNTYIINLMSELIKNPTINLLRIQFEFYYNLDDPRPAIVRYFFVILFYIYFDSPYLVYN